jgi:spore germination protein
MICKRFFPFIAISLLLTGCVEKEIIDDVNIEMGAGFDLVEDDKIEGTIMVPVFNPDKNIGNFTFSSTASSSRDLYQDIQRKSAQPVVTGSLEVIMFGKALAKKGVLEYLDSFERDPSIGARIYLAVADDNAKDILSGTYGNRGNAIHLSDLIKHNTENRNLPITNFHMFLSEFYQQGNDPYLPILKKIEPEVIDIVGVALFKDDKMVDELGADKMFFFKLLTDRISEGNYRFNVGNEKVAIKDLKSKSKLKLVKRNPEEIIIKIKLEGLIREYTGQIINPAIVKKIEKEFEQSITEETTALIAHFQEKGIDPVGFGQFLKSKTRNFDFKKWEDDYKNITIHVETDAKITEVGIIE